MKDATKTRWLDLCAEAAICDIPARLEELAQEIVIILREEHQRLTAEDKRDAHRRRATAD